MWWFWGLLCHVLPYHYTPLRPPSPTRDRRQWGEASGAPEEEEEGERRPKEGRRSRYPKWRSYHLYESETGSDVTLLVGEEGHWERVPAHSWILISRSEYFRAMLQWPASQQPQPTTFPINADPRGFHNLLKWLYRGECLVQSVEAGLTTLHVAVKFLCPALAEECVRHISPRLTPPTVLRVLQEMHRYCPAPSQGHEDLPAVPSAPSLSELEDRDGDQGKKEPESRIYPTLSKLHRLCEEENVSDPTLCCRDLFNACLDLVDKETLAVLASEQLEDLDIRTLEAVVRRDTLTLPDEVAVVTALHRWSTAACKRKNLPLTQHSRRYVLTHLVTHVRFLTMTADQLRRADSLLEPTELSFLTGRVTGKGRGGAVEPPHAFAQHLVRMSTPRRPSPPTSSAHTTDSKGKSGKKKYTRKELVLDIVSCLAVIFD